LVVLVVMIVIITVTVRHIVLCWNINRGHRNGVLGIVRNKFACLLNVFY
jgi:hypothetical protein